MATDATSDLAGSKDVFAPSGLANTLTFANSIDALDVPCSVRAAAEIASRSRGAPRIANALLRRVRDFAQVKGSGSIDTEIAQFALEALNIDKYMRTNIIDVTSRII